MNIKQKDLRLLLRGYELDKDKAGELAKSYEDISNDFMKCAVEQEKYQKHLEKTGKKIARAFFDCYNREYTEKRVKAQNAYIDLQCYLGGKLYNEIMKEYERSDKSLFDIVDILVQAGEKIPSPTVVEGTEDMFSFPDCYDENEIFRSVKKQIVEIMEHTVERPMRKVMTKSTDLLRWNNDNGTWEMIMSILKKGEVMNISLEGKNRSPMKREIELLQNALDSTRQDLDLGLFDILVLTICESLRIAGNEIINTETIARVGRKDDSQISEGTKDEIRRSILKLMSLVRVDLSAEVNNYHLEGITSHYHGQILPSEFITAEINGQVVDDAIRLLGKSIFFEMAERKKQVDDIPVYLIGGGGNNRTKKTDELSTYLLRRVEAMEPTKITKKKRGKETTEEREKPLKLRTIRIDSLLKRTIPEEEKRKNRNIKARHLKKVEDILTLYKETGKIYSFCFNYAGADPERDEKKQKIIIAMNEEQGRTMWDDLKGK